MDFETRMSNVKAKVEAVKQLATRLYRVDLSRLVVVYDLRGKTAGWAHGSYHPKIRLNVDMIANNSYDAIINNTIQHEMAHIVCHIRPELGRKHDLGWKRVCIALGGNGKRCHQEEVMFAKGETYEYITDLGVKVNISRTIHNRLQTGRYPWYGWRRLGRITKNSPHTIVGVRGQALAAPIQVSAMQQVAPIQRTSVVNSHVQPKTQSNASKVREWIRLAKSLGRDQESVIMTARTNLGMPRSQAVRYVTENWDRA